MLQCPVQSTCQSILPGAGRRRIAAHCRQSDALPAPARAAAGAGRSAAGGSILDDTKIVTVARRRQPRQAYEISRRTILDVHKPMTIRYNQRYNPTPRESCDVCSASPHSRNHASSALSAHIAPRSTLFGSLFPLRLAFARAMRPCPCHRHRAAAAPSSRP